MSDQSQRNHITAGFNLAVFAFSAALGLFQFLIDPDKTKNVPALGLILSTGLDAMRYIAVLLITALIIREFWNRLISDLSSIRNIQYQEAIAGVLVLTILLQ